ncbi:hypothetical protein SAMN05660359_03001 [Geodermatophilus obscurus]|uniref:Uncharacterized protein n=1 Tax=Geodermatophilus obscurus TaxID=1861 RepID=A0A1I5GPN7_9ACTN|nr:hypothetical protein [Geodermatophilus obscurus]SFO37879.1 hypothetical protein SAMN05660359_03001 [Geodermatophilus obscurus]
MNGALKAAWALTAFVVLVGLVGWITTGEVFFAVFIVLGLVTAVGAWLSGRSTAPKGDPAP